VGNIGGTVTKVTVTISNLTHTAPVDIDMLLVGPGGEKVMLMSDAGGTSAQPHPVNNVTLTFDGDATTPIPGTNQITSGTYSPMNYAGQGTADAFPAPAPLMPYTNTALSTFNGVSPNGNWSLFVVDDTAIDAGSIGGWTLSIQTSDPVSSTSGLTTADLSVAARVTPSLAAVGADVTATISISNHGPATASSVALVDNMPAGLSFVSATASVGSWRKVAGTFTWNVGSMTNGAGASMTILAKAGSPGNLASQLTVSGNEFDPNVADNSTTMWTRVVASPVLLVLRLNNNLQLSWPADSGLQLQFTDSLSLADWKDIGTTPQVQNGQNVLTVGVNGATRFYRLRSP
jgi:uncharacterized repeat protein (TIGR01451 family)